MARAKLKSTLIGYVGAVCITMLSAANGLAADGFPTGPVRIVVNTGAGGLVDVTTRLVAEKMGQSLGQPVIVENRAGGDGLIGIQAVKRAKPDGYTLLATANTFTIQPAVKSGAGYDIAKDFSSIGGMIRSPYMLVVGANEPDKTLEDFIERARQNPQAVSYASAGTGTTSHIAAAMFLQRAGLDLLHVPYKGNGPAMPDVMAGRVSMIFEAYGSGASKLKDGTLRALGVTSNSRLPGLKDVPTIGEKAVPGFSFYLYIGLVTPAGTPKDVIDRLSAALQEALKNEEVEKRFRDDGSDPFTMSPQEFDAFLRKEETQTSELVQKLGLRE